MAAQDQKIRISLGEGENTDSFSELPGVSHTNNVVPSPDGQSMFNRNGLAKYGQLRPVLSSTEAGRIAYSRVTSPPNLTDGHVLLMGVNTGRNNAIVGGILARPRGNADGDSAQSVVSFSLETYSVDFGEALTITVIRQNAIDRLVTVDVDSSNGSASAGTDYTLVNTTLTFQPGETTQTFTFTSTAAAQTSSKTALLTMSNATGGAVIGTPNPATVFITATYAPLSQAYRSNGASGDPIRMMFWDKVNSEFYLHYLGGFQYQTGNSTDFYGEIVGPDTICVMSYASSGGLFRCHLDLYSINAMRAQGAAYSAGGTDLASALKAAPYASLEFDAQSSTRAYQSFHFACYDDAYFYAINDYKINRISLADGSIAASVLRPAIPGMTTSRIEEQVNSRAYIGTDGLLVLSFDNSSNQVALAKINPDTGALVYSTPVYSSAARSFWRNSPLSDGAVAAFDGIRNRLYRLSYDLATEIDLGALTLTGDITEAGTSDYIMVNYADRLRRILVGTSSFSTANDYFADTTRQFMPFFSSTRFASWLGSGGTFTLKYFNVDGTELSSAAVVDFYDAQLYDSVVANQIANAARVDAFRYTMRAVTGRVRD
jgi:hypothetical protein